MHMVQQLLDQVQRLQSTLDAKMGVLQHLAEQTADTANQMTATVNALQQKLNTENDASGGKLDAVSGQDPRRLARRNWSGGATDERCSR